MFLAINQSMEPYRELLLIGGGLRCAATSLVRDDGWPRTALPGGGRARQLIVGPVTDTVRDPWPLLPLEGRLGPASRFAYRHRPLRQQRNYAEVLLKVPAPPRPKTRPNQGKAGKAPDSSASAGSGGPDRGLVARVAAAKIIGHFFEEVSVVVGPVVGLVQARAAVVLVEVDAEAPVACILVDSLTGSERRQLKLLPANRPFAFKFESLSPGRHFVVRFEGVENGADRMGSFATPLAPARGKSAAAAGLLTAVRGGTPNLVSFSRALFLPCLPSHWV